METEEKRESCSCFFCLFFLCPILRVSRHQVQYYQKALEISIECNDELMQAKLYQDLATLASLQNQQHQHDDYDHKVIRFVARGGPAFYDVHPLASIISRALNPLNLKDRDAEITGDIQAQYEVQKDGEKVLLFSDTPGPLIPFAYIIPIGRRGVELPKHRFLSARALKSSPEVDQILGQSKSVEDFIRLLRKNGYQVSRISKDG